MTIALANGASLPKDQNSKVGETDEGTSPDAYHIFRDELTTFVIDLLKLVRNCGGATTFVGVSFETECNIVHSRALRRFDCLHVCTRQNGAPRRRRQAILPRRTLRIHIRLRISWGRILSCTPSTAPSTALEPPA